MTVQFPGAQLARREKESVEFARTYDSARLDLKSRTAISPVNTPAAFRRAASFDSLERRYLLSADISPYSDAIDDGLDRLEYLVDEIAEFEQMAADIPVLGESLAELGSLADTLDSMLIDPLRSAFNATTDTFDLFIDDIEAIVGAGNVSLYEDDTEARYTINFSTPVDDTGNTFDLGAAAQTLGISFDGLFNFTTDIGFTFDFGVLFDPALSPSDQVFIGDGAALTLSGTADLEGGLEGGSAKVGLLGDLTVDVESASELSATVALTLEEDSALVDGRISISELDSGGLGLVAFNPANTGTISVDVLLDYMNAAIPSLSVEDAGVSVSLSGDFFDNPQIVVTIQEPAVNTPDLDDFTRLNAASLLGFLADLGTKLETLAQAFNEIAEISFIDINVGDFSDFDGALRQLLTGLSVPGLFGSEAIDVDALAASLENAATLRVDWVEVNTETSADPTPHFASISIDLTVANDLALLETEINGKLSGAGIPLEVVLRDGFFGLQANSEFVTEFQLTQVADALSTLLGIQVDQTALPIPTFETIQEFAAELEAADLFGGAASLDYHEASKSITFNIDISYQPIEFNRTLGFNEALDLGPLGELALAGSASVGVSADLNFSFGAGFDLTGVDETTPLSLLNGGLGVGETTSPGDPDLVIVTLDGFTHDITLNLPTTDPDVGDVISAIETGTGGKVQVEVGPFGSALVLTDTTTAVNEMSVFSIVGGAYSQAIFDLGFGFGIVAPEQGNVIGGASIIDRFFIDADSSAGAGVSISMSEAELFGAIGFVTLEVTGETTTPIGFTLDLELEDVNTADGLDRLYLTELTQPEGGSIGGDIVDLTDVVFEIWLSTDDFDTDPATAIVDLTGAGTVQAALTALSAVTNLSAFLNPEGTGVILVDQSSGSEQFTVVVKKDGDLAEDNILGFNAINKDTVVSGGQGDGVLRGEVTGDPTFDAFKNASFRDDIITGELLLTLGFSDSGALGLGDQSVPITVTFETGSIVPMVDLSGLDAALETLIDIIRELGSSDLLTLVSQIAGTLFDELDLLNADLPFLDSSLSDLLQFVEDGVDGLIGDAADRINSELVFQVDKMLAFLDPARAEALLADVTASGIFDTDQFNAFSDLLDDPFGGLDVDGNIIPGSDLADLVNTPSIGLLFEALEELKSQVLNIGGGFDFLFSDAPSKLIAAFAAVRSAIGKVQDELTGTALDTFNETFVEQLDVIEDIVPSTRTILRLVQEALGFELPRLDDTLGDVDDALDRFGDELRDLLVAASDDPMITDASHLLNLTIAELIGLAAELIEDVADEAEKAINDVLSEIDDVIASLTDGIDELDDDVPNIQQVIDTLNDSLSFLTDDTIDDSLAQIIDKLRDIADKGEDIFDLVSQLPAITRMLALLKEKTDALFGSLYNDLAQYFIDENITAGTDALAALAEKAVALAEASIEQFRATVLAFFNGGMVQFDYQDGLLAANLSLAPSIFDVNIEEAGFEFDIGGSLFNAGFADGMFELTVGGTIDIGLGLILNGTSGLSDPTDSSYIPTNFDLVVASNTAFELTTEMMLDGRLFINLGGIGIYFENTGTEPELQLTNGTGTGPASIGLGVMGPELLPDYPGWIAFGDVDFDFSLDAQLSAALFGYFKDGTQIIADPPVGDDYHISVGFDVGVSVMNGEFDYVLAGDLLDADELAAIAAGLIDFSNLLAAFETILDFLIDVSDSLSDAPIVGGPLEDLNQLLTDFQMAYEDLKTFLEGLQEDAADLQAQVQQEIFDAVGAYLDADAMMGNAGDAGVFEAEDILLDFTLASRALELQPLTFNFGMTEMVDFDFGLDSMVLEVEGEGVVEINLDLTLVLGLGLSADRGAYIILPEDGSELSDIFTGSFSAAVKPIENTGQPQDQDPAFAFRLFFLGMEARIWDEHVTSETGADGEIGLGEGVGLTTVLDLGLKDSDDMAASSASDGVAATEHGTDTYLIAVTDLGDFSLDLGFEAAVNIDLHLLGGADFGGDFSIDNLPNITALMNVDWMYSFGDESVQVPGLQFYDVELNMGQWAQNALGPLLDFIDDFTAPLDPFFEFLNLEIPILSQLSQLFGQGPLTVLDAIRVLGSGIESIEVFLQVVETIQSVSDFISNLADGTLVDFGDFIISDPYGTAGVAVGAGLIEESEKNDQIANLGSLSGIDLSDTTNRTKLSGFSFSDSDVGTSSEDVQTQSESGGLSGVFDSLEDIGLNLPFLEDPSSLFGLFFGQRVDFIVWDIPRLSAEFGVSYKFGPILPPVPLFVTIGGGFEIFVDLSVGYDSRGLETGDFGDGFFFGDFAYDSENNQFTGEDILELGLSVYFQATASLSVVVAEAGVTGGVEAEIGANWADDNGDGKFYLDEIEAKLAQGILCIFDFEGALQAFLEAFVKLGFDTPFGFVTLFEDTFELLRVTLLDFTITCPPLPAPQLGSVADNVVTLNIGDMSDMRQPGADPNADVMLEIYGDQVEDDPDAEISLWAGDNQSERLASLQAAIDAGLFDDGKLTHEEAVAAIGSGATYFNKNALDVSADGDIDPDEIKAVRDLNGVIGDNAAGWALVIGFGEWEVYKDVTAIRGISGAGDDEIIGDPESLKVALWIDGGAGDDELIGGMYADILYGNIGDDIVRGFGGNDSLHGDGQLAKSGTDAVTMNNDTQAGDGEDDVFGGGGADSMFGGGANDVLKGDGEPALNPSNTRQELLDLAVDGADFISGQEGEDAITGSLGNDTVTGGQGADNIEGNDGDDLLVGDGETDLIQGGKGADIILGGAGNDIIFGEEDGFELAAADDPTTMGDLILGNGGDDDIRGQYGDDTINGNDGDDQIIGGAGDDDLDGDDDNDTIYGDRLPDDGLPAVTAADEGKTDGSELGLDSIEGGDGADVIFGQQGADSIIGGTSTTGEYGSGDADQGDTIRGGAGNDIILGDDGSITDGENYQTNAGADGTGGNDRIFGEGGDDQVAGGQGNDLILGDNTGGTGEDILFGDELTRAGGLLTGAHKDSDGQDSIFGFGGSDVIVGGGDDDDGFGSDGDDLIAGDYAKLELRSPSETLTLFDRVNWVVSIDPTEGGVDRLLGDSGRDIILGGTEGDFISGGGTNDQGDILLGDHGLVVRDDDSDGVENDIFSLFGDDGGDDFVVGGNGPDIMIGGAGDDTMNGGTTEDVILGDAGLVLRTPGTSPNIESVVSTFAGINVSDVFNSPVNLGMGPLEFGLDGDETQASGNDLIFGGADSDIAIGGLGLDRIFGQTGDDVMLGDNGQVEYDGLGNGLAHVALVKTRGTNGGIDALFGEDGGDIGFGGAGGDYVFGDLTSSATVELLPTPDITFGGFEAVTEPGDDVLAGDFGELSFFAGGLPQLLTSTDEAFGGRDLIEGHEGDDVAIGGADSDAIHGEAAEVRYGDLTAFLGNDVLLGDSGLVDWRTLGTLPDESVEIELIQTTAPGIGAPDFILGNDGDDIILGGADGDYLYGDRHANVNLDTLMISDETLTTTDPDHGPGYDRILGDSGLIDFVISEDSVSGRFDITNPVTLDAGTVLITTTYDGPGDGGNDVILGGGLADLIFGGTGSDRIWGDDGDAQDLVADDEDGNDIIFGDHGKAWQRPGLGDAPFVGDDYFSTDTGSDDGGDGDVIFGESGDDIVLGQQGDDVIFGNMGNDNLIGGHNTAGGSDDLDGMNGVQVAAIEGTQLADLNPTDLQELNDIISGDEGDDLIAGDNAYIYMDGGQATGTAGGPNERFRELAADATTLYSMTGQEIIVGAFDPFHVDLGFAPNIGNVYAGQADSLKRNIFLLDFDQATEDDAVANSGDARPFGDDLIAGGEHDDQIFGQLGDDIIQGDGDIALVADEETADSYDPSDADPSFIPLVGGQNAAIVPDAIIKPMADTDGVDDAEWVGLKFVVGSAGTDGDDYVEGNGGNDRIYGNLGQDDLIGGTSELAAVAINSTLTDEGLRPDGADLIYGGSGEGQWLERAANVTSVGDTLVNSNNGHTADADVILGDNANIFRLLDGATGVPLTFNYAVGTGYGTDHDNSTVSRLDDVLKIRVVSLLDYAHTVEDPDGDGVVDYKMTFNDFGVGAGDLIHGESGDDIAFGMTGDDVIFGEAGDDDLYGQAGADVLLGGRGVDGLVGDDGLLSTSRNGQTEELIGLTIANEEDIIRTPGNLQIALIYRLNDLLKTADMIAFDQDGVAFAIDGAAAPQMTSANDIIFGGWENDFIHSGFGDDAVSGAEALPLYYDATGATDFEQVNDLLKDEQNVGILNPAPAPAADPFWYDFTIYNPGDILRFAAFDDEEFALYDEDDPRSRITVSGAGLTDVDFLLNNDASEGPDDITFTDTLNTDGADHLFGDLGNDWIVGGTGRDHMFGGRGNDLLQMDDDLSTGSPADANTKPDSYQEYADIVYDGAGRDYIILNTGADRAIGWVGEYNSYITPFSPFGAFHISRSLQPQTEQFVLDLASASGGDTSMPDILRFAEQFALDDKLDSPADQEVYEERRGSPFNELGMVRQEDFDWQDQSGPPDDPQAGNDKGARAIMRREIWDGPISQEELNAIEAAEWYIVEAAFNEDLRDANSIELVGSLDLGGGGKLIIGELGDGETPYSKVEISTHVTLENGGNKKADSTAYAIFDVADDDNFYFAGLDIKQDRVQIGQVVDGVWTVLASVKAKLNTGQWYDLTVRLEGSVVTVLLNGVEELSFDVGQDTTDGEYGVFATDSLASFDGISIVGTVPIVVSTEEPPEFDLAASTASLALSSSVETLDEDANTVDWTSIETAEAPETESDFTTATTELETTTSSDSPDGTEEEIVVEAWAPRDDFAA